MCSRAFGVGFWVRFVGWRSDVGAHRCLLFKWTTYVNILRQIPGLFDTAILLLQNERQSIDRNRTALLQDWGCGCVVSVDAAASRRSKVRVSFIQPSNPDPERRDTGGHRPVSSRKRMIDATHCAWIRIGRIVPGVPDHHTRGLHSIQEMNASYQQV